MGAIWVHLATVKISLLVKAVWVKVHSFSRLKPEESHQVKDNRCLEVLWATLQPKGKCLKLAQMVSRSTLMAL